MRYLLPIIFLLFSQACTSEPERKSIPDKTAPVVDDPLRNRTYAYAFELKDLAGKFHSLRDLRGKVVLVNFWATWCVPCLAEMPALENLYQKYRNQDFVVVAISVDDTNRYEDVADFLHKTKLSFPVLLDDTKEIANHYMVEEYPETFLIDAKGKFIAFNDPKENKLALRITGDRKWDSDVYQEFIAQYLTSE